MYCVPFLVIGGCNLIRRPTEEGRQGSRVRSQGCGRTLEGLQKAEPLTRGWRGENASRSVDHGGHTDRFELISNQRRVLVGSHEHREVSGPDWLAALSCAVESSDFDLGLR